MSETVNIIRKKSSDRKSVILAILFGIPVLIFFLYPYFIPNPQGSTLSGTGYLLLTVTQICLFSVFAISLNLETGFLGLANFGKIAFIAIGGYSYYFAFTFFLPSGVELAIILGVVVATITTGVAGIILAIPSLKLEEDYFAIMTIVAGEILRIVLINESETLGGPEGFTFESPFIRFFESRPINDFFLSGYTIIIFVVYLALVYAYFWYTHRKLRAIHDPEKALNRAKTKATIVSILLGLIISILNFRSLFGEPSWGLDVLLVLTPFLLLLSGFVLNRLNVFSSWVRFHVMFIPIIIVTGVNIALADSSFHFPIKYADWYKALLTYYLLLCVYIFVKELLSSPFGRTLRAIRDDKTSATAVGKNVFLFRIKGLFIANALTGIAGVIFAYNLLTITPDAYKPYTTFVLYTMVIIGGTGNNKGVIYGVALITMMRSATTQLIDYRTQLPTYPWDSTIRIDPVNTGEIIIGVLLIVFLIYAPKGIFPEKQYNNQRYYDLLYLTKNNDVYDNSPFFKTITQSSENPVAGSVDEKPEVTSDNHPPPDLNNAKLQET